MYQHGRIEERFKSYLMDGNDGDSKVWVVVLYWVCFYVLSGVFSSRPALMGQVVVSFKLMYVVLGIGFKKKRKKKKKE